MDEEFARAFNALNVRLHVVENALDAIFSLAAKSPALREALIDGFQLRIGALQDGMAASNDAAAKQVLRSASDRLLEALESPVPGEDGPAPT